MNEPFAHSLTFHSERRRHSHGVALVTILITAAAITLLITFGYIIIQEAMRSTRLELSLKGQAYNVAASGLVEGISWFRSRRLQPVKHFNPKPTKDTLTGETGLVRNIQISGQAGLWGRYALSPDTVEDITDLRGRGRKGDGLVWRLRSKGVLYMKRNAALPYNQKPNEIIHTYSLMTEIQRLNVDPPSASAILAENGAQIEILEGGRVRGLNGAALTYRQGTGKPTVEVLPEVTSSGSNRLNPAPKTSYSLQVKEVFGVTWRELKELSDIVADNVSLLPPELPRMGIFFVDGKADFTHLHPLRGGGILIVDGDLTLKGQTNFTGLIYCRGAFNMEAPGLMTGSVIGLGAVRLQGFGDFAEVQYNSDVLSVLRQRLGQYHQTQAFIHVKS